MSQEKPRCYNCDNVSHLMKDCKEPKSGSKGKPAARPNSKKLSTGSTKQVTTAEDPLEYFLSDSEGESVKKIELKDGGSELFQGVPATGLIDSESDITIMGGELFKVVAVTADKTP